MKQSFNQNDKNELSSGNPLTYNQSFYNDVLIESMADDSPKTSGQFN